jgi:photosystem II stability/assembly factor-like uncharacterized protein
MTVDAALLQSLAWRSIGPHRGGRVVAVAGDPIDPATFYFGACAGGVWKTTDAGTYWENISDGFFKTASVGALAVSDSDPNVIYAGTGEACIRIDVTHGDGVYKSTDSGNTWTHQGLADTRHIARVRIHPTNPEIVYVAALGHAFGPNRERGVFRSRDGGASWEKVLFVSEKAGAIDLCLDPANPRVLYAAIFEAYRKPWMMSSGGPDSGLYKSTDGGDTWQELTNNPGLPSGVKGRIGVAAAAGRAGRVWALIEAEDGGLFRSDDAGATWERLSQENGIRARPWYFTHIFADPQDPETIYSLALKAFRSTDGGRSFSEVTTPHGDNHDLWIDPRNPRRMIEGNDGGACVSFNAGASWSSIENQPTAEFYHVAADSRFPYRLYGTQQDNSAISTPSRSNYGVIPYSESYIVGSSESGHIAVRPDNPNIVYSGAIGSSPGGGGALLRYDHASREVRVITVWPELSGQAGAKDLRYRFQWTYPIVISPHDPTVLYCTGNHVFRSTDDGTTWEVISPDLTRDDPSKQEPSGGPISKEGAGADVYCTIFALAESPHERGVLWAGSDDGLIHLSRDNGATWQNVTPPQLPEWATVAIIEPSPHDAATAYVAAYRYKLEDNHPYLYKTNDYGATWRAITAGIPDDDFTRVIREDPARRGLLYAGTETGAYVSLDDGESWQPLRLNLPVVPVYDLIIKDDDLALATHGRSFWIMDDLSPLRQIDAGVAASAAHLFQPRPTYRVRRQFGINIGVSPGKNYQVTLGMIATHHEVKEPDGSTHRQYLDAGENIPDGVIVTYYLKEKLQSPVTLTVLNRAGETVARFSSAEPPKTQAEQPATSTLRQAPDERGGVAPENKAQTPQLPAETGANRFVWDMHYPAPTALEAPPRVGRGFEQPPTGPLAPPGRYQLRLEAAGQTLTQDFELLRNPLASASQADLEAQFALLSRIRDKISDTQAAANQIHTVLEQIDGWQKRLAERDGAEQVLETAKRVKESLTAIRDELVPGDSASMFPPARLNVKLNALTAVVDSADAAPTHQSYEMFDELAAKVDALLQRLDGVLASDLEALSGQIGQLGVPPILAPRRREREAALQEVRD